MAAADASIAVTVRDDAGTVIATDNLSVSAYGHKSFLVGDQYPAAASKRGTIEFRVPPGGQIATLAFRAALGTLSTIPSMAK